MKEWEEHMMDFVPDDMISFELLPGQVEVLEEYVPMETKIRGAYFI
jgi:hypothetical protein